MKKIEYAIAAAGRFVQHLHRSGFDRGMIATFGDRFRIEQRFTTNALCLHQALARLTRANKDGSTRLYDSLEDGVMQFWQEADPARPWVLIAITDGQDNSSVRYRNNPYAIGTFMGAMFNHEPSNFPFIIGVGEGGQINRKALTTIGEVGGFPAVTVAAFPLLELAFMRVAAAISTNLGGGQVNQGNLSWDEVARMRAQSQTALDYAFLIDLSGSMDEQGD